MNRTWLAVLLSLLVCGAPWSICCGQGTSGSQFLGIEAAARPMGMGGAFVSVADGVTSLGWNPAGLVRASGHEFSVSHVSWLEDVTYQSATYAVPLGRGGAVGIAFEQGGVSWDNTGEGSYEAGDFHGTLGYGRRVRPNVGVGGSVKYLRSTLGDDEASSYAVDVGVLYSLSEAATLGAAARNLGPGVTFIEDSDPLPAVVAVGGSYSWKDLVVALDVEKQNDLSVGARLGVEYSPIRHLALRGGVISGEDSALSPFVGGVGVTLDDSWALDYAYRPSDLGGTQWLAVSGRFGSAPAVLAAAGEDEPQVIETLVPRSNLAVITDLTTEVVNEALLAMRVPEGSEIYLKQVDQHGASWLVQSILLEELTGRGHVVKTGTMSAGASETEERSSFEISYRIVGCGTTYPRAWREWLVGTRKVERRTSVDIYFQLSDESKAVIWAGSAQRERRDIISGARLAELSTPGQPFTSPEMEFGGWDKVLEPLVVAGIIGGLIYLFYTSKSTD